MDLKTQNGNTSPSPSAPHAVVIPHPFQGHVTPAVHLSIKLASSGFTVTFVNTHYIHHKISRSSSAGDDIFSGARKSGLDIRYRTISDGFPLGFDRPNNDQQFSEGMLHVFPAHVEELVGELVAESAKEKGKEVRILIADTFLVRPAEIAEKYGLLYASFWTEPALVLSLYYHMDLLTSYGHFGQKENRTDMIDYIPGVNPINPRDMQSYLQPTCTDIDTVHHRIIRHVFPNAKRAHFSIINTVHALEPDTLSSLQQIQPTYSVGPIFPSSFTESPVTTSLWAESDCSNWLDSKPDHSVLYISFGSYVQTSKTVIQEVARGLLLSGIHFIWVVRPNLVSSDEPSPLPTGFEKSIRAADTGLVVTWTSQRKVLSHRAVGGFLTHCGWNSTLESVWCGVPLLCYPLFTDQFTNRKLAVDDWKVGINLCDGDSLNAEEVSLKIKCLMKGESADQMRIQAEKMRNTMKSALERGGSSELQFDKLVKDVKMKVEEIFYADHEL